MTYKRLFGVAIAACALFVVVGSIGAGAARTPPKRADLSTNAGVREYLRSLGISPRGVVIQRGARNYAGPRCPGKRWTCTRSHRAIQIASHRGKNRFRCSVARCVVVQVTRSLLAANTAKCIRTTGITQSCTITQSGTGPNTAIVYMSAVKKLSGSGLTQNATQTATITQTATAQDANQVQNKACVSQITDIQSTTRAKTGVPVTAMLDAHQSIRIVQDAHSGGNVVQKAGPTGDCPSGDLNQSQTISSTAIGSGSITQNENKMVAGRNMFLDIEQNQSTGYFGSATGPNTAAFSQTSTLTALATTSNGPVQQWQSQPESAGGGVDAIVNQDSRDKSTASAFQKETQCARAVVSPGTPSCATQNTLPVGWTQTQYGPVRKGGHGTAGRHFMLRKGSSPSSQTGNGDNTFIIDQESTQDVDAAPAGHPEQVTQANFVQADCSTAGNCTATQTTDVNGATNTNVQSGQNVTAETNCTGSACTTTGGQVGGQLSIPNTDVGEFGFGGMRNDGTGTITVTGVSGTVTKALLYWNGPTNSTDPTANANVDFAGSSVTGVNLGFASDNCWGFSNSHSYRADVTPFVSGDGTYSLANFTKPDANINGVALLVFYNDGNSSNDRNVVLWNGNDSNVASSFDAQGWDETITGVPYPGSGTASLDFVVSDGQAATDDALVVNGTTLVPAGPIFEGDSTPAGGFNSLGDLWDVKSFDMTSFLTPGSNDLHLTTGLASDCLSLVVMAANVPASAPVIEGPTSAAKQAAAVQAAAVQAHAATYTQTVRGGTASRGGLVGR